MSERQSTLALAVLLCLREHRRDDLCGTYRLSIPPKIPQVFSNNTFIKKLPMCLDDRLDHDVWPRRAWWHTLRGV